MEPQRLADIRAGDARSSRSYGSGYLIAPQLVLTARHTVVDSGTGQAYERIDVRVGHTRQAPLVLRHGEVCWIAPADGDVAMVWLSAGVHPVGAEPVRWARLAGGRPLPYEALGYPLLAEYTGGERHVEQLRGDLSPLSTGPEGMLVLDQAAAPRPRTDGARAWSGVSGAAVFCRGTLVGVVVRDDTEFENRRLHAWPSHAFADDPEFVSLLSRHGGGTPRIEEISGSAVTDSKPVDGATLVWPTSAAATVTAPPARLDGHGSTPYAAHPAPSRAVTAGLPPAPATFTGREAEAHELVDFLDLHHRATAPTATALLVGMAGVGKTALALHAAHAARSRGCFGGGVFFLDAHGYGPSRGAEAAVLAGRLLRALGLVDLPGGREDLLALWHDQLARLDRAGHPVLILLDDVATVDQVVSLLPGESSHRVLITSRHDLVDLDARHIRLGVLDSRQSVRLVDACLRVASPQDERFGAASTDTVRLAELCGGLPLALRTIASLLRSELDLSPSDLVEELADTRQRLDGLSSDGMSAPVRAAFDLSFRHLRRDQQKTFRLMSVNPGAHVSTAAVAAVIEQSPAVTRRLLRSLARAHLIERGAATGASDTWTMHDLVRIYAQEQAEKQPEEYAAALDRLLTFYVLRAQAVQSSMSGTRMEPREEGFADTREAMTWLQVEGSNVIAAALRSLSVDREEVAVNVVRFLIEFMIYQERGEELVDLTRATMNVAMGAANKENAVETLVAHGHALISAGRPEDAVTVLRSALGTVRSEPMLEAVVRTSLGSAYRYAGKFSESALQCRAAATLLGETGDLQRKGMALINLGNALRHLDRPQQAVDTHRETVSVFRQAGDRYREAFSFNNLGNALSDIGDHEASHAALRQAVDLFRESGAMHLEITSSVNLAFGLRGIGRHADAAGIWEDVARLCHRLGDPEREFAALSEAGRDLQELRDYSRLLSISKRGVVCAAALDNRQYEIGMVNNVAVCLTRTGHHEDAVITHVRAALLAETIPDPDEPHTVKHQVSCAIAAAEEITDSGQACDVLLEGAVLLGRAGLRKWQGWVKSRVGLRLNDAERFEEAVAVLRDAAASYESAGDRSGQGAALNNLGISLRALSRYEESAQAIRQDMDICREADDRPGLATSLLNLAETLSVSGDAETALTHWQEALDILVETGADADTLDSVREKITEAETAGDAVR